MTDLSPDKKDSRLRYVTVAAFAAILATGFIVTLASLRAVEPAAWQAMADWKRVLQGESTRRFTTQLNDHFLWSKPFAHIERSVTWTLAGETGTSVRTGCHGWFFLSEELEPFPGAAHNATQRAAIVARVAQRLQARGVHLLVAVVPDKTRIEADHLCGLHRPPAFASRIDDWIAPLQAAGVDVFDLRAPLTAVQGERYYRTDSHWNEAGAQAAAQALAQHLRQKLPSAVPAQAADPKAIQTAMIRRPGDLLRVANLDGVPEFLKPEPDHTAQSQVAPVAVASDDLFGDAGLPEVALVGTSFSRAANFIPFLSHHLCAPVASLAKDGGNFEGAAMNYLGSASFRQSPPKVVLWEVPERMLQQPLRQAEKDWLAFLR